MAAADHFDRPDLRHFAHGFLRAWSARSTPYVETDNTAPGHAACAVVEQTADPVLLRGLVELADWLRRRPRVGSVFATFTRARLSEPYGGEQLSPADTALLRDPGPGVYVDCLHFDPPFFAHLGRIVGSSELRDEAVRQALGYLDLLYDPGDQLFRHFYLERTGRAYIRGWGRGQGWAVLGLLDVIELLAADDPHRERFAGVVRQVASTMIGLQRRDGHWATIVDDPVSGDETSTAAFMAAAFWKGVELGVLDPRSVGRPAELAWQAALSGVDQDGKLDGVSAAVGSCTALSHYRNVPTGLLVPWGQGPLLLAAARRPSGVQTEPS